MQPFEVIDARSVRASGGADVWVLEAIDALPWVNQLCPLMPHQYAVLRKSPEWAWFALDAMIRQSPESYRAYFRGYRTPNLYWDGPDGMRYWRTRFELNRCAPDSVEPPRRVAAGSRPIAGWVGPPWAPNGSALYVQEHDGRWRPKSKERGCSHVVDVGACADERPLGRVARSLTADDTPCAEIGPPWRSLPMFGIGRGMLP